jgi:glutathione S-transferase
MPHYAYTALATLLAVLFYALLSVPVGHARAKSGIKAPTMVGDDQLERALRIQGNTLEWLPIFLPALWLAAAYVSDPGAAALGIVWIVGRFLYARGYAESPEKRERGYMIQLIAAGLLWAAALVGIVKAMIQAA